MPSSPTTARVAVPRRGDKGQSRRMVVVDGVPPQDTNSSFDDDYGTKKNRRSTTTTLDETVIPLSCSCSSGGSEEVSIAALVSDDEEDFRDLGVVDENNNTGSSSDVFFTAQQYPAKSSLEKVRRELERQQEELFVLKQTTSTKTKTARHVHSLESKSEAHSTTRASASSWKNYLWFEAHHSSRGTAALLLTCLAHAATYEFISNLAYEAVDGERAIRMLPSFLNSNNSNNKTALYTAMLLLGCGLARISGLLWEFLSPSHYNRVKFEYHNRLRLGALDAKLFHAFTTRLSDVAQGAIQIVAFYLCYIAAVYFLSKVAVRMDQRDTLLEQLPSAVYERQQQQQQQQWSVGEEGYDNHNLVFSPARDYSPEALFGQSSCRDSMNTSAISATESTWDPMGCAPTEDQDSGKDFWAFGQEDDRYFYSRLSKNSYEKFFGQDFEAAMFDTFHQVAFNVMVVVSAIYILKAYFGVSFWACW